ncbi:unnamed protein product [Rhizoctonia solani]|uniref:Transmembrane protein n=1 Tax=Rhizoctonia solani TaxID=456999 RepID=A0A8H3GA19_9AGAM|nr:unnamed protein product [Rhizoctonia solani]
MNSGEKLPRHMPDQGVLFAFVAGVSGDDSNTRASHDVHTQESGEIPHNVPANTWAQLLPPHSPPAVSLRRRSVLDLVAAFSSPRANHLVSIPNTELPLTLTQKADAAISLAISVPRHPQFPTTPLAGAGSQVLFLLCMSEPLQPASESSSFFPLPHGLPFLSMGPVVVAALGAGAFVTTAAAGVILLRRKFLGKAVEVDVEKGLEDDATERRERTGPGWKEYTEIDEKGAYELRVPLVAAFQSQRESDVADTRTPLTPMPRLPTLHHCQDLPTPNVRQQVDPLPILEGGISDTHNQDRAPVFPPGLPVPAKVAVDGPISARLNPLSELDPLDTGVSGITSWPVLAPTPVEEMRTRANGQGEHSEPDIKNDVVPQDEPSASSPKFPCELEIAPGDPIVPVSSESIHESDDGDPFADPVDSVHSPCSEVSLEVEEDVSPACSPRSTATSLDDSDPLLEASSISRPDIYDSISISPILWVGPSVAIPESIFPANIPLPESPPASPKVLSPLLIRPLPLDTVVTTTVVFGDELSPDEDVSDYESSSPVVAAPFVPVLPPIIIVTCPEEDLMEAPRSPVSDAGSSSSSDSSGPDTPTGLKHDLPFSPVLEVSSKASSSPQLSVFLPSEGGADIDDDMDMDDFVMVEQQAPDPPSPTIDIISPEWTISKLPGSFEDIQAPTSDRTHPEQKLTGPIAVADVPPLTADMIQLCHALLAVSNCAGLVAQVVVGFSVWWSLTLVPA